MCWQLRWLVPALCSAVLGCATITQKDSDEEHEEVPVQVLPDKDLIGVWDGTSVAYCSPVALYPHNCLVCGILSQRGLPVSSPRTHTPNPSPIAP